MTEKEFIEDCKYNGIYWYKKCLEQFKKGENKIIYVASTPLGHNYNGYQHGTVRCSIWTEKSGWQTLFDNLKWWRARVVLGALKEGTLNKVNPAVLNNYMTNGHSTKKGLFYRYTEEEIERMGIIARSHAEYLIEPETSPKEAHNIRVQIRKQAFENRSEGFEY